MRIIFIAVICLYHLVDINGQECVLYGMRSTVFENSENTTRIFFDRNGELYPEMDIPDKELMENGSALQTYFSNNTSTFVEVLQAYEIHGVTDYSDAIYRKLQDAIQQRMLYELHTHLTEDKELFVLVHGFRKPMQSRSRSSSARADNQHVKSAISTYRPEADIHYLEVYWDGTFISIPNSLGSLIRMGRLFKKAAIPHATNTGLGLRSFISKINFNKIHIVAHSLGAQVVNNCLFNANIDTSMPTPIQDHITVCLVAPAIARKPFRRFYERSIASNFDENDNYHYTIIYNERDIVIAKSNPRGKRKYRFTRFYGNTKLGCNCANEAVKVSKIFGRKYPGSQVKIVNASVVGRDHRWKAYAASVPFKAYIEGLE
ncbi:MAG: alpha/beta hydrolase [Bacteroidia bacterium]|nr:alpha/beta hydrolase [Bacteroidia bacterium]